MWLSTPKTLRSQITTIITASTFRMLFILRSMGMKLLISHNNKPATISTIKMVKRGIMICLCEYETVNFLTTKLSWTACEIVILLPVNFT
jgi:hypothetical protein